jgi:polyphosphate kinase 2 (PPK2 family)
LPQRHRTAIFAAYAADLRAPGETLTLNDDELQRRIQNDLEDGYDEELELELEDRNVDALAAALDGRDAGGKGGVIERITQRLNPRVARVVVLPAPNDRGRTQWYFRRLARAPAGGWREGSVRDRSCYNRAGVERMLVRSGI